MLIKGLKIKKNTVQPNFFAERRGLVPILIILKIGVNIGYFATNIRVFLMFLIFLIFLIFLTPLNGHQNGHQWDSYYMANIIMFSSPFIYKVENIDIAPK